VLCLNQRLIVRNQFKAVEKRRVVDLQATGIIETEAKAVFGVDEFSLKFAFQTNGVRLDQEWCNLFKRLKATVGISCDGPAFLHDRYRVDWAGRGSHRDVVKAFRMVRENGLGLHVLATVTSETLDHPDELFHFFKDQGVEHVGLNFVDRTGSNEQVLLDDPQAYERAYQFMARLFDLYLEDGRLRGEKCMQIRELSSAMSALISYGGAVAG